MNQHTERRRSPRVDLVGQLQGQLRSRIRVREISLGGMSIETPMPFEVGDRHEFMLTLGDGAGVVVVGRIVYSRPVDTAAGRGYVSGIQFLDEDAPETSGGISGLIDRVR